MVAAHMTSTGIASPSSGMSSAIGDVIAGLRHWELWGTLGWHDIRQRYRRSIVGPLWLTLSMGIMVAGLAFLYAGLFGKSIENYLPYVATGMIVFNLISTIVTESADVFIGSASLILQLRAPLSIYVHKMLWRNLIIFAHNMSIYLIILVFAQLPLGWNMLLALPGLFLLVLFGVWVGLILGTLSARFRDIPPIAGSIMQVAFFLTPVFWLPSALSNRELFVHLNPFYYLLEVIRMPLLGQTPPWYLWGVVVGLNCVCAVLSIAFFARYRARIAYWV